MSACDNASVLEATRDFVSAIHRWLVQHGDMKWQVAKTQHDLALSQTILDALAQPETIPPDAEWHVYINITVSRSAEDEEWAETSHWWEVFIRASGIVCDEYRNLATIIGAGQTYLRSIHSTDDETDEQRRELDAWRASLNDALQRMDAHVNVASRNIAT